MPVARREPWPLRLMNMLAKDSFSPDSNANTVILPYSPTDSTPKTTGVPGYCLTSLLVKRTARWACFSFISVLRNQGEENGRAVVADLELVLAHWHVRVVHLARVHRLTFLELQRDLGVRAGLRRRHRHHDIAMVLTVRGLGDGRGELGRDDVQQPVAASFRAFLDAVAVCEETHQ